MKFQKLHAFLNRASYKYFSSLRVRGFKIANPFWYLVYIQWALLQLTLTHFQLLSIYTGFLGSFEGGLNCEKNIRNNPTLIFISCGRFQNGLNFGFESIQCILEILERLKSDSAGWLFKADTTQHSAEYKYFQVYSWNIRCYQNYNLSKKNIHFLFKISLRHENWCWNCADNFRSEKT